MAWRYRRAHKRKNCALIARKSLFQKLGSLRQFVIMNRLVHSVRL
ncbi:Uncharacterized protein AC499_3126 [Pseudomonas amygdali pv. lachrymans]|uniref:Uncharacterized protein n=3 Tax=Pseudomonas amygdali TaxID=47877 RepID=A0A3M6GC84_PSEAJ|nr:Uncharacterized protein AC501_0915 [Pseudomonas amygdali pv. lachrymans]KPX52050.1 hypothetical protein ALO67_102028 [Pseudomonas amygdali pv. hibisci]RMV90523.1 hypothetical protein ALP03_102557 [Pseudomonas amygdali pv. tabaci]KPC18599.1 Uncharacterized protein AC499_3126 [Pseudomonas amygdali pv. lachrymans]RMM44785.1 hypothetical protein ALQ79_102420 [Pseudomonas amygdali pv. lachrymans]